MPRTLGRNQIHVSQILGWTESERDLLEINPPVIADKDRQIAALVAAYIHDGDTIQVGIGAVPNAIMSMLGGHNDVGVHTDLLSDGLVDLAIGREDNFVSVNASLKVDLLGQCASESIGSRMYSGSGGQSDLARGAMYSQGGRSFIVLHSTTSDGGQSRICPQLTPGARPAQP